MAELYDNAEPSYDWPDGPRPSRERRDWSDPEWRPELEGEPSNVWMAADLEPLDRSVLEALASAEGPLTLMALEVALAPAAAADRFDREAIRGAACMLDALRFADIVAWDDRGMPSVFGVLPDGRAALASLAEAQ